MDSVAVPLVENPTLKERWRTIFKHSWSSISLLTCVACVDKFSGFIAKTGVTPEEINHNDPFDLASKTKMTPQDAGAICIAIKRFLKHQSETAQPDGVDGAADHTIDQHGNIVINSLELLGEAHGHRTYHDVNDLDYAERALVACEGGDVDFSETLLCSAGPRDTVNAEQSIHLALTIPQVVLISSSIADLTSVSSAGDERVKSYGFYYGYVILSTITLYLCISSFMLSLVQISLSSFTSLTDRSAAHYLSSGQAIRFSDLGLLVIGTLIYPLAIILNNSSSIDYDTDIGTAHANFTYIMIGLFALFIPSTMASVLFLVIRERNAFKPFPAYLNFDTPYYSTAKITNSDPSLNIQNNSLRRKIKNTLRKMFLIDPIREVKLLGFIGRWRKYELGKRFRESMMDACAEKSFSKEYPVSKKRGRSPLAPPSTSSFHKGGLPFS